MLCIKTEHGVALADWCDENVIACFIECPMLAIVVLYIASLFWCGL